jgi:hypothetical protein
MRVNFRQGLLRYQTDTAGNPTFLQKSGSGIDLVVSPDPTVMTFADGTEDYTHEERQTVSQAWDGPFTPLQDYWLYVDIDVQEGVRTFGETQYEPIVSYTPPPNPAEGQHWFDKNENIQKVRSNNRWVRVLRVFVAKLASGSVLQPYSVGSQVGLWSSTNSGFILFDENDKPVQRQGTYRQQRFLTTDSPIGSQFTGSAEFRLEGLLQTAVAVDNIPAWAAVCFKGPGRIGLATNTAPAFPAIGLINEDAVPGELVRIITSGFYTSSLLNFVNADPGDPLFVGTTGLLTSQPPQQFSIQEVATVVSRNRIYVDVKPLIRYQG